MTISRKANEALVLGVLKMTQLVVVLHKVRMHALSQHLHLTCYLYSNDIIFIKIECPVSSLSNELADIVFSSVT